MLVAYISGLFSIKQQMLQNNIRTYFKLLYFFCSVNIIFGVNAQNREESGVRAKWHEIKNANIFTNNSLRRLLTSHRQK